MRRSFCVLGVLLIAGCGGRSGPPIDIIVPNGFKGSIWIVLDPAGGDIPLIGGRYQVAIPAGGVLRVRSFDPFERWHQSSARYADGSALPEHSGATPVGPGVVALRGGGEAVTSINGKEIRWLPYFVGTEAEHDQTLKGMNFPPGFGQ